MPMMTYIRARASLATKESSATGRFRGKKVAQNVAQDIFRQKKSLKNVALICFRDLKKPARKQEIEQGSKNRPIRSP
jgi:hypothetical protein